MTGVTLYYLVRVFNLITYEPTNSKTYTLNKLLLSLSFFIITLACSQPTTYTVANAHSHNDYEQPVPLLTAYKEAFGSIEADIFWHNGELLVAHSANELAMHRTLEDMYLK